MKKNFSVSDIIFDFILFFEYIGGSNYSYFMDAENVNIILGNVTTVTNCTLQNITVDGRDQFSCIRYEFIYFCFSNKKFV